MQFQPDPILVALIFAKRLAWLPALGILALLRTLLAKGASRGVAALVCLASLILASGILASSMGLAGAWVQTVARTVAMGGGWIVPGLLSAVFLTTAILPGRRAIWIDAVHVLGLAAIAGLWGVSQI
ncbi:hypothetical protein [Litorisediminicola beolgyonensis]|uniref:Uncharacterized protein n=1 Tax=Litorisediminicola beolgyonensis TaxID=1173614 RepID=A0ABW3ZF99_9RHOB